MKKFLETINSKEKKFIYGTGKGGERIKTFLMNFYSIAGFIVSTGYPHPMEIEGIPVYECCNVPYTDKDIVIVAVDSCYYNSIVENLVVNKIKNVCFLPVDIKVVMDRANILYTYNECEFNHDILDLGEGFKIFNLLKFVLENNKNINISAWFGEMGDLVFPYINNSSYIAEGPYEYKNVKLQPEDIVLDLGANFGLFSAKAASKLCDVYAFEPVPEIVAMLKETQKIYGERIHIVPNAVADKSGKASFYMNHENLGAGGLVENYHQGKIDVDVITIDEFVKANSLERVDFIKADIEGAERLMLKGAEETLKRFAPKLSICTYHLFDDVSVLTDLIKRANPNYKIEYAWMKLYAWVEK